MQITLHIPDDIAALLISEYQAEGGDLTRRTLEAMAADEFRNGRLGKPELQRLLGIHSGFALDGFLKEHEVWIDYSAADLERELLGSERLGLGQIVADTCPLFYLLAIDRVEILAALFGEVLLPEPVRAELRQAGAPEPVRRWAEQPPGWAKLARTGPEATMNEEAGCQGAGERAAIALAISIGADMILIDERKGIDIVLKRGSTVMGTLGILAHAAKRGLIDLAEVVEELRATSFRYRPEMLSLLLARHAESN
jgi:predicted nucleic acid-binding protein